MLPDPAELQLLFALLNNQWFGGEIPGHRIAYNARFSNLAGRITYKPPLIELSPKHFDGKPDALRETLLHEMIHAWLYARGENPGHTAAFKRKMRELGLRSIYHDLGSATPHNESKRRFILRCDRCTMELLRKRRPPANVSCGRCSPRRFDARYPLRVLEVVDIRDVTSEPRAAQRRDASRRDGKPTLASQRGRSHDMFRPKWPRADALQTTAGHPVLDKNRNPGPASA